MDRGLADLDPALRGGGRGQAVLRAAGAGEAGAVAVLADFFAPLGAFLAPVSSAAPSPSAPWGGVVRMLSRGTSTTMGAWPERCRFSSSSE